MNEGQINEGVKEVILTLLSLAATSVGTKYILNKLDERPEPIESKIEALKLVDDKSINNEFDVKVNELLKYYTKLSNDKKNKRTDRPVLIKSKKINKPVLKKPISKEIPTDLVDFIKKHEKFFPNAYWDHKQYSIGYGTKAKSKKEGPITKTEAHNRLLSAIKLHRDKIIEFGNEKGYNWSENQINALTSFRFNIGTLSQLTDNGNRDNATIAKYLPEYIKASGKPLEGLVKRRAEELKMFLSNE